MPDREPLISSSACRSGRPNAEGSNCLSANAFKITKPNYERTCCPLQFHEYYRAPLLLPFSSRSLIKQKKKRRPDSLQIELSCNRSKIIF